MAGERRSTTAAILSSLELIRHELGKVTGAIDAADRKRIDPADLQHVKRVALRMTKDADELLSWLSEVRLETPRN